MELTAIKEAPDPNGAPARADNEVAMTTAAAPAPPRTTNDPVAFVLAIAGYVALFFALPFVLLLGGPVGGWAIGGALFVVSFAIQRFIGRVTEGMDPTHAVGLAGISSIGRAMVVVMILFVIALKVEETMGLVAGGVFAAAFTFDLMGRTIMFAIHEKERKATRAALEEAAAHEEHAE